MAEEGLPAKVTFDLRPEGSQERAVQISGAKCIPGRGTTGEIQEYLEVLKNSPGNKEESRRQ